MRTCGRYLQELRQLTTLPGGIAKRKALVFRFEEEIERIDHCHFRDQIYFQGKVACLVGKDQAGQKVSVRVLLPVDEVIFRLDAQRITRHLRSAVRRGAEAHHLRRKRDQPVVLVNCLVMKRDSNAHQLSPNAEADMACCRRAKKSSWRLSPMAFIFACNPSRYS